MTSAVKLTKKLIVTIKKERNPKKSYFVFITKYGHCIRNSGFYLFTQCDDIFTEDKCDNLFIIAYSRHMKLSNYIFTSKYEIPTNVSSTPDEIDLKMYNKSVFNEPYSKNCICSVIER
jgi:hypothetical protein